MWLLRVTAMILVAGSLLDMFMTEPSVSLILPGAHAGWGLVVRGGVALSKSALKAYKKREKARRRQEGLNRSESALQKL